jgi:hypothetical protein
MQFDPKASTPKVLFTPAAAVNANDLEVLQRQGKSAAAESAVKLTVYQNDEGTTEVQVQATPVSAEVKSDVDATEPVLRPSTQAAPQPVNNASEVMKKWSVKS